MPQNDVAYVVICFQISIFEPLETVITDKSNDMEALWFAFKLVSLNHWKQFMVEYCVYWLVVICFQISIFEPLETVKSYADMKGVSCDLLSN